MKNKNALIAITLFCLLGGGWANSLAFETDALSDLESLSAECMNTSQVAVCRRALMRAEVLQRQAASIGNYACQSYLLGLEADLLMVSFQEDRNGSLFAMLKQVKMRCSDL